MTHPILKNLHFFEEVLKKVHEGSRIQMSGLWDSSKAALAACLADHFQKRILVVTPGLGEAERFYRDFSFFSGISCHLFPAWETLPHENVTPHVDIVGERFGTLMTLLESERPECVIAPVETLLWKIPSPESFKKMILNLSCGDEIPLRFLMERLVELGYSRGAVVEEKGRFAVRGGILDFYSLQEDFPYRVEFEADRIVSLRVFDPQSQVSLKQVERAKILPAFELELRQKKNLSWGNLSDFFSSDFLLVLDEAANIFEKAQSLERASDFGVKVLKNPRGLEFYLSEMEGPGGDEKMERMAFSIQRSCSWEDLRVENLNEEWGDHPLRIFSKIGEKTREGFHIYFVVKKEAEGERLKELLQEKKMWKEAVHHVVVGDLSRGFVLPLEKKAILTDEEIFGRLRVRPVRTKVRKSLPVQEYSQFEVGDCVVHGVHGIARYRGVSRNSQGKRGEYLTLEYANQAKLYVPVDQIELVERYIGIKGQVPRLSRLGRGEWERSKKKAEGAIHDFAAELLDLQAKREALGGYAFGRDTPWQNEFEASFIYEETPDQWQAIEEVKRDLESPQPMDRLVCGDVGYGKTEVAIRAAFKVVMEGKQVAILVPTTVLAQQHLYTFQERFSGYPIQVEMLSRFRSESEQGKILKDLKEGKLDVVIGTHRLLNQDVVFKDLGLLVIDEEQRFGVFAKEKLKKMRISVDVLTLSATPIPRTLYLSLMEAKDMSLIMTAPQNRLPIETVLAAYDDQMVRDAIVREVAREGQVFFIHNRVGSIYRMKERLEKWVPGVHFEVAHGQMPEDELEEVMKNFIEGKIQVLVSTNIVESGLDIPNANTIIIDRSEHFGLADLYQLRGRVGRLHRRAYAYLLYSRNGILTKDAKLRLKTIEDFKELGSGFKVAMRDLEIRGAGNILGRAQHGQISAVGFGLYCRLLQASIRRIKKEEVKERHPVGLQLGLDLTLPPEYIPDDSLRLQMYRKIFEVDSSQKLVQVSQELIDRFGPLSAQVLLLIEAASLKNLARSLGITLIQIYQGKVYFKRGSAILRMEICPPAKDSLSLVRDLRKLLKGSKVYGSLRLRRGKT
ncbi:MAG: transcription-repair coupling factor [Chlamydiae bacterium]|nr:transcription-repair coupling factor [Chlamydiota bacterium]MBI3265710.1 transcription-repair coupling factor [Chlamydiota bacterium]